jgi:hypothetical protein
MQAAREKLKSDRSQMEKVKGDVQTLMRTRRASVDAAMTAFKTTLESAKAELKTALGNK